MWVCLGGVCVCFVVLPVCMVCSAKRENVKVAKAVNEMDYAFAENGVVAFKKGVQFHSSVSVESSLF